MNGTLTQVLEDCDALLVPNAIPVTLRAGEQIMIIQAIGGSYTISVHGNMARVDAKHAAALGLDEHMIAANSYAIPERLDEEAIWEVLSTCYDPEIPVNIVELGLIYQVEFKESTIAIQMTLTAAGCGMGPVLVQDVQDRLKQLPGIEQVNVELVFDPPWNQGLMSEAAKLQLGML
jgi:probable FeS assembly SUF system protein SufT